MLLGTRGVAGHHALSRVNKGPRHVHEPVRGLGVWDQIGKQEVVTQIPDATGGGLGEHGVLAQRLVTVESRLVTVHVFKEDAWEATQSQKNAEHQPAQECGRAGQLGGSAQRSAVVGNKSGQGSALEEFALGMTEKQVYVFKPLFVFKEQNGEHGVSGLLVLKLVATVGDRQEVELAMAIHVWALIRRFASVTLPHALRD